ncbi:MAG: hypothetical protein NVS1B4_22000 [Gemmatimonadaceae bacterium]
MHVLVTGGSGVVGASVVDALVAHGHTVRLFTRRAATEVRRWPVGVEAHTGDVATVADVHGAADGCDAVVHATGIVAESPPDSTFARVNVEGTRNVLGEVERAGVPRLIVLSSLGAERGKSPYHASKRAAEAATRGSKSCWTICRPGNVYGPGDAMISALLTMVRTLPVVPVIGDGDHSFQPLWHADLALGIVSCLERRDLCGRTLELAGADTTSPNDLIARMMALTDRSPLRLPLPEAIATMGIRLADLVGLDLPVNEGQLTMLREENVVTGADGNALVTVLGLTPTSLDAGLRALADAQPEVLPGKGWGPLERKRIWIDIRGSRLDADALFAMVCERFGELTPVHMDVGAEPGTPRAVRAGETLTMALPLRGHVQVRVEEMGARTFTLVTLAGHALAGGVLFSVEPVDGFVRFEVQVYDHPATLPDFLMMKAGGAFVQTRTWMQLAERVCEASGGEARDGVQKEIVTLDDAEARGVASWIADLVAARDRAEAPRAEREAIRGT